MKQEVLLGDCLVLLKEMDSNSVDAVITDPPYGYLFMGKKWDYDVPKQEIWDECLRVLKPGGYLLAFAGTRTQHRMAVRIEDAGFEIRDMIMWVYGSGFPKSLNIGKMLDKVEGNEREVIGVGKAGKGFNKVKGFGVNTTKGGDATTEWETDIGSSEWEGWGSALKPACEPITVARKPIEGTIVQNCLKWGVGGINIDACRVETEDNLNGGSYGNTTREKDEFFKGKKPAGGGEFIQPQGRFPANFIHDGSEEVVELFPETKLGAMTKPYVYQNNGYSLGKPTGSTRQIHEANEGSAARFFYCAKASKAERNAGCEKLPLRQGHLASSEGGGGGWKSEAQDNPNLPRHNHHPTVKPIALMEYLIKLVTREGAVVVDPFAGSGTTGIGCVNLKRNFVGMDITPEYVEIAQSRITFAQKNRVRTLFDMD